MKSLADTKIVRLKADGTNHRGAAGMTPITTEPVNMAGFDRVSFLVGLGAIAAGAITSIKVRQAAVVAMTNAADLTGTSVAVTDATDNTVYVVEVVTPQEPFLDLVITRGTANAEIDFVVAVLHGGHGNRPYAAGASVSSRTRFIGPAPGTA